MTSTSVVILNWNGAECLRRFLPSVVANTPAGVEVVVADNGSTDDSAAILAREFPSVRTVLLGRNFGFAEGYNHALEYVGTEYCVLLNSDVETPTGWLDPLVARLDADPAVAAVGPKILSAERRDEFEYAGAAGGYIDILGYPFCRGRIMQDVERDCGQYDDPRRVFWVSGAAFCCRTDVFRRLGGFAADFFAHMEEIDLCWRMQLAGYAVAVEPASRVYHLGGGTLAAGSPDKIFYNHRNNLMMLFRCAPSRQRLLAAVVRPFADIAAAVGYLCGGNRAGAGAVVRAWRSFLSGHGRLLRQRRAIRSSVVREASDNIYNGSIVVRRMFGKRKFGNLMQQ